MFWKFNTLEVMVRFLKSANKIFFPKLYALKLQKVQYSLMEKLGITGFITKMCFFISLWEVQIVK